MKSIWAHVLVKNEERYLWYAVTSVIDFVDRVLLWDTGSSDNSLQIIREIQKNYPSKVDFKETGEVTPERYTEIRQEMLESSKSDWFLLVDGDEVWWKDSIKKVTKVIQEKGDSMESLVVKMIYPIGDIFHYQEEAAGNYQIDGEKGHIAVRAVNCKIPGLHYEKPHGKQGIYDAKGVLIQNRDATKRLHLDASYLHFSHLPRSGNRMGDLLVPKRKMKLKYEVGYPFPKDYFYPEVFFRPRPSIAPSIWGRMDNRFLLRATLETPLRKAKRRIFKRKVGY